MDACIIHYFKMTEPMQWRNAVFQQQTKRDLTPQQYKRFRKLTTDSFYFIGAERVADHIHFQMYGSGRDVYTIKSDCRTFTCNCMDSLFGRCACVCKHICFILTRVLRYYNVQFYTNLCIPETDVSVIQQRAERVVHRMRNELDMLDDQMKSLNLDACNTPFLVTRINPTEQCAICYDTFGDNVDILVNCPACKQIFHTTCMTSWLNVSKNKTCVYCRSTVWCKYKVNFMQ